MDSLERKRKLKILLIHLILILVSLTMLVPFFWMILTSFKSITEATSVNPFVIFPKKWRTDAFRTVFQNMNFLLLYRNTLLLIFFRVLCAVVTATLAGYAFARLHFPGRDFAFSLVLFQSGLSHSPVPDGFKNRYAEQYLCTGLSRNGDCFWYLPSSTGVYESSKRFRRSCAP